MDGVLIDSHPAHRAAWKQFLHAMGRRASDTDLAFILEGRTRTEILRHFFGDLDNAEIQEYGRRKDEIFRGIEHQIGPVRGVLEFIEELGRQQIPMAIATSASEIRTSSTMERLGLGGRFEAVITASDVFAGKPDPMVYRLACERLSIHPQQALAFDDACSGVISATSAGMRCIGVASNGLCDSLLRAGAEAVIPHFAGLLPLLSQSRTIDEVFGSFTAAILDNKSVPDDIQP
jgi:HAD superfamily hydrolase (TIGR01509 family)